MNVFIFGAGYSARAFARQATRAGHRVVGTTRATDNFERLRASGVEPVLFDGQTLTDDAALAMAAANHLVVSVGPDEDGDPVLRAARDAIGAAPSLEWIGYLSTVGVYGDHGGAWVDEATPCRPVSRRSVQRLDAERAWLEFGDTIGRQPAILRLSGIYGPGRNAFVNIERGKARRIVKPGQVFNRIHVEDIAGALMHLAQAGLGGVFNVTDDEPAPPQDVILHAARMMGVAPPPEVPFEEAGLTSMARSFYGETKRVSNARLKASGYALRHPDYRHALAAMWADHDWRAEPLG